MTLINNSKAYSEEELRLIAFSRVNISPSASKQAEGKFRSAFKRMEKSQRIIQPGYNGLELFAIVLGPSGGVSVKSSDGIFSVPGEVAEVEMHFYRESMLYDPVIRAQLIIGNNKRYGLCVEDFSGAGVYIHRTPMTIENTSRILTKAQEVVTKYVRDVIESEV